MKKIPTIPVKYGMPVYDPNFQGETEDSNSTTEREVVTIEFSHVYDITGCYPAIYRGSKTPAELIINLKKNGFTASTTNKEFVILERTYNGILREECKIYPKRKDEGIVEGYSIFRNTSFNIDYLKKALDDIKKATNRLKTLKKRYTDSIRNFTQPYPENATKARDDYHYRRYLRYLPKAQGIYFEIMDKYKDFVAVIKDPGYYSLHIKDGHVYFEHNGIFEACKLEEEHRMFNEFVWQHNYLSLFLRGYLKTHEKLVGRKTVNTKEIKATIYKRYGENRNRAKEIKDAIREKQKKNKFLTQALSGTQKSDIRKSFKLENFKIIESLEKIAPTEVARVMTIDDFKITHPALRPSVITRICRDPKYRNQD
jgi:hypothetical protein